MILADASWLLPWHALSGNGYQFYSGSGSDLGELAIIGGIGAWWTKHNCHEHRCPRLSWHPDDDGHPVCKVHHADHPARSWFRTDRSHPRHATQKKGPT